MQGCGILELRREDCELKLFTTSSYQLHIVHLPTICCSESSKEGGQNGEMKMAEAHGRPRGLTNFQWHTTPKRTNWGSQTSFQGFALLLPTHENLATGPELSKL